MFTLGINAAYHDPAACLVLDGQVLFDRPFLFEVWPMIYPINLRS